MITMKALNRRSFLKTSAALAGAQLAASALPTSTRAALRFVREHADEWGFDPDRVFAAGASAGKGWLFYAALLPVGERLVIRTGDAFVDSLLALAFAERREDVSATLELQAQVERRRRRWRRTAVRAAKSAPGQTHGRPSVSPDLLIAVSCRTGPLHQIKATARTLCRGSAAEKMSRRRAR